MDILKGVLIVCLIGLTLVAAYYCLCFRYELGVAPSGIARLDKFTGEVVLTHEEETYRIRMVKK